MNNPFETIPAWRIAKLRAALADAERRGADPNEERDAEEHRALSRRFAQGRNGMRARSMPGAKPKTTRKGRRFPLTKQVLLWRAILNARPAAWKQGDKAAAGAIKRAHTEAIEACRLAGLVPPRYRTVYVLWHRGVPTPAVLAALGRDSAGRVD